MTPHHPRKSRVGGFVAPVKSLASLEEGTGDEGARGRRRGAVSYRWSHALRLDESPDAVGEYARTTEGDTWYHRLPSHGRRHPLTPAPISCPPAPASRERRLVSSSGLVSGAGDLSRFPFFAVSTSSLLQRSIDTARNEEKLRPWRQPPVAAHQQRLLLPRPTRCGHAGPGCTVIGMIFCADSTPNYIFHTHISSHSCWIDISHAGRGCACRSDACACVPPCAGAGAKREIRPPQSA
jgi:hypothetical protein